MTVAELIAQLSAYPADMPVYREDHEWSVCETRHVTTHVEWLGHFSQEAHPAGVIIR
jgi:hypothetical protein